MPATHRSHNHRNNHIMSSPTNSKPMNDGMASEGVRETEAAEAGHADSNGDLEAKRYPSQPSMASGEDREIEAAKRRILAEASKMMASANEMEAEAKKLIETAKAMAATAEKMKATATLLLNTSERELDTEKFLAEAESARAMASEAEKNVEASAVALIKTSERKLEKPPGEVLGEAKKRAEAIKAVAEVPATKKRKLSDYDNSTVDDATTEGLDQGESKAKVATYPELKGGVRVRVRCQDGSLWNTTIVKRHDRYGEVGFQVHYDGQNERISKSRHWVPISRVAGFV